MEYSKLYSIELLQKEVERFRKLKLDTLGLRDESKKDYINKCQKRIEELNLSILILEREWN